MSKRYAKAHPCPTAAKASYGTQEEADGVLAWVVGRLAVPGEKVPVRSYRCECGHWHLTSQEKRAGQ